MTKKMTTPRAEKNATKALTVQGSKAASKTGQTDDLKKVLADTFVLYMKTYAVHWNYKGSKFFSVHKLTEAQYGELADAIDEIAERIRALGDEAPLSLADIIESSDVNELKAHGASSDKALQDLADSHRELSKKAKEALDALDEADDDYSVDMMVRRIGAHDKAHWLLQSFLKN